MSDVDTNAPRAGWYPDPAGSAQQRWWNGTSWTDALRDAPSEAPAAPTPQVTAPPVAPVAPAPPVAPTPPVAPSAPAAYAPAYGEMRPGAAAPAPAYGAPGYHEPGTRQHYAAAPPIQPGASAQQRTPGLNTNTPWIWLIIGLSFLSIFTIFLIDPAQIVRESLSADPNAPLDSMMIMSGPVVVGQLLGWLAIALSVLFAFLDYRALIRAGVQKPFHWAWNFFALVVGPIVYVIGRSVVVKRVTGGGVLPLWIFIASVVVQFIVVIVWTVQFVSLVMQTVPYSSM